MTAAGGDRGDNTARCTCGHKLVNHGVFPGGRQCAFCDCGRRAPVPAADRQTDEELFAGDREAQARVSAFVRRQRETAARPAVADAVMADPGAAITEGVTEARLREAIMLGLRGVMLNIPSWYPKAADHLLALREMRALLDARQAELRAWALAERWMREGNAPAAIELRAALGGGG